MYNYDEPPPLVAPVNPGSDGFFNAFPGHQRQHQSGMPPGSPWPHLHEPPPQWPPASAPPAWLNNYPGSTAHAHSHSWGAPSPFGFGQVNLTPSNAWDEPPAPLPWSPTRPTESTLGQPITSGFFGANNRAPNTSTPNHSPWHGLIRSISDQAEPPHSAQPSWMAPSSWDVTRPKSAGPDRRSHTPFQPARVGTPAHLMPDTWDETNLARRPRDWRPNYNPRASFISSIAGIPSALKGQSDVQGMTLPVSGCYAADCNYITDFTDPVKRRLSVLIEYNPTQPPVSHDLRLDPLHPSTPILHASSSEYRQPLIDLEMAQFATSPTTTFLRLFHPRLPWYIDIAAHSNGVTVGDVLSQVYQALMQQILPRHYWNEVLNEVDRRDIGKAYQRRVALLGSGKEKGILWIDFLCDDVIFEGLTRTKGGLWEMKMRKAYA